MPTKRFENLETERKEALLETARAEFTEKGYDAASLNVIVREAGISKGSLYYYFEDKTDLYLAVLGHVMNDLQHNVGGIAAGEYTDDFWGDIDDYTRNALRLIKKNPDFVRLAHGLFLIIASGNIPDSVAEVFNDWKSVMTEVVLRGQKIGEVRTDLPLDLLVNILWGMGESLDHWIFSHIDDFTTEELESKSHMYVDLYKRVAGAADVAQQK